ncbi:hypothetical protein FDUTEX481_00779 [Tolypothrix sp. PCC 7601]|nr:hypothetical protein FDUTEX481_00779 [Tolypothrix sp. PCC 7601]
MPSNFLNLNSYKFCSLAFPILKFLCNFTVIFIRLGVIAKM